MPLTGPSQIRKGLGVCSILWLLIASAWAVPRAAGQERETEQELISRGSRLFPDVGPGLRSLKRDAAGRYYILASPENTIFVFSADGKRAGQIPNSNARDAKILYAVDLDLDSAGRILVADRGANAVRIYAPDGSLLSSVHVSAPTSIACLSGGDFAVTLLRSDRFVTILNENGSIVRSFGNPADASPKFDATSLVARGRLFGDSEEHIYFAFAALGDPTFRVYNRFGFAAADVSLPAADFVSAVDRWRVNVFGIPRHEKIAQNPSFNAVAVDLENQDIWAAVGNTLLHFDKDGTRIRSYRTYTADGTALDTAAILVEPTRILLASDPLGVFEFARPDKRARPGGAAK